MKIKIIRTNSADCTEGKLYIDNLYFCDTLEDVNRDENKNGRFDGAEKKIHGDTCIPYGTYVLVLSFSERFQRELPLLVDVPSFSGIRIHSGNTVKHTEGCILVGKRVAHGYVSESRDTERKLINFIKAYKEKIVVEIV